MGVLPNIRRQSARHRPGVHLSFLESYRPLGGVYDELCEAESGARRGAAGLVSRLDRLGRPAMLERRRLADAIFRERGITFSVYGDGAGVERIFPFDPVPRVLGRAEWARLERGLIQRLTALNTFLQDVYGKQRIMAEGIVPRHMVEASKGYLPAMRGVRPNGGTYVHIGGIDLVRRSDGVFVVLEDNLRTPSGVSYVIENRNVMKRVYPELFKGVRVRTVDEYPTRLRDALHSVAPPDSGDVRTVVLTPGPYNSAYFEHCFLARRMGCDLVQGSDLVVWRDKVYVKTTQGPQRVHVIYRRIDDAFLDPETFRPDSTLGVPGLVRAYAKGNVTIANAIGNGVADDKAIYPYVPRMIRFYLDEEPILEQVETFICDEDHHRKHVLANLDRLVVKSVDEAGGYGMLMGHQATKQEREAFAKKIRAHPRGFIAQPLIEFSTCPTMIGNRVSPRRVDLRPYLVTGTSTWVLPGGLTRVALQRGSYVVNSSQGGGSKDTWVQGAASEGDE